MRPHGALGLAAAAVLTLLAGCVTTPPEEDPVQIKLRELDGRIQRIERVVANQSLLDLAQRVDASQTELRTLRGRLEELENGSEALRKQQRDLYADLDKRVGAIGTQVPAIGAGVGGGVPGAANEQQAYTTAFDALRTSNYPTAISGFNEFLATYPQSEFADNARYWLGEAYYVTRDYKNAAAAFGTLLQVSPNSRKAPDALLKLGYTQFELKELAAARATLTDVTRRFPGTDAARLAGERLARIPAASR